MKFKMKGKAGFSLVELMIVVGIIGILATLGMPKLQKFMAKARQTEAKNMLTQVYTLNEMYILEHATYTGDLTAMGYVASGNTAQALYEININANASNYVAYANNRANKLICAGNTGDNWTINHTRFLTGNEPVCN